MRIRLCIADDHLLVLTGIRRALERSEEIEVVGSTQRGDEVLDLVDRLRPDLLLLDNQMPGLSGLACLKLIRLHLPEVKVVMLSASEDVAQVSEALSLGASAYIGKRINPDDLASALRQIVEGVVYQTGPADLPAVPPQDAAGELTERELEMLDAIARGLSTKVITANLWVSEKTVKFHLTNVYRKLGVHNRTSAVHKAYAQGLLSTPDGTQPGSAATHT